MAELTLANKLKKRNNKQKIQNLMADPPAIQQNKILFYASNDFSDNALALYEHMVEVGLDKKYEIVWLVRDVQGCKAKDPGNAKFVMVKDDKLNMWTWEAQREAMSSGWLFFTHSLNWVKLKRKEQTYVNLWHGCGYKGRREDDTRVTYFDYCLITGKKYIEIQEKFFLCNREKLLATGYPRSDWFRSNKTNSGKYIAKLKESTGADKTVLWMPTYRRGKLGRLDDATTCGNLELPLIETTEELEIANDQCKKLGILIVIKIHNLQKDYSLRDASNIICINDDILERENVNLYEFMAETDGLLTDYSSVATDYMLLDKPIGFILDDFDEYEKVRGWSFDNVKEYMPGDHIYDLNDLEAFMRNISNGIDKNREWRHRASEEMNTRSDNYCKAILKRLGIA